MCKQFVSNIEAGLATNEEIEILMKSLFMKRSMARYGGSPLTGSENVDSGVRNNNDSGDQSPRVKYQIRSTQYYLNSKGTQLTRKSNFVETVSTC